MSWLCEGPCMDQPADEDAQHRQRDTAPNDYLARHRAARLTSVLGIAFAVLFLVGLGMLARTPGPRSTDQELVAFYASGAQRGLVLSGLYVLPLAAVAFLWFIAALRQWVEMSSRKIDHLLATVQMLSGVGFITLAFAAAGAATIVASSVELADLPVDPDVARQARSRGAAAPEVVRLWQLWRGRGALSGGNPQRLAGGRLPAVGAGPQR